MSEAKTKKELTCFPKNANTMLGLSQNVHNSSNTIFLIKKGKISMEKTLITYRGLGKRQFR